MVSEKRDTGAGARAESGERGDQAESRGSTLLRLEGQDCLAVLHRISTQKLDDLGPGNARGTLFCDFRGRLLHRAAVAVTGDHAVWLLRPDAPARELMDYIEHHVFREDVRVATDGTREIRSFADGFGMAPGTLAERAGVPERIQIEADFGLSVETADGAPAADDEPRRILAGRPRHGHEVHPDFNPFEVGLAHEVHLDKGCFTGQEALMRLVTYRSVRRQLVRVSGAGLVPEAPRDLISAGEVVGRLTSTAAQGNGWIGLAVLKRQAIESAAALEVVDHGPLDGWFPFPETRPLGLP